MDVELVLLPLGRRADPAFSAAADGRQLLRRRQLRHIDSQRTGYRPTWNRHAAISDDPRRRFAGKAVQRRKSRKIVAGTDG
jgi:hypothetical protein